MKMKSVPGLLSNRKRAKKPPSLERIIRDFVKKWKMPIRVGASGFAFALGFLGYMREALHGSAFTVSMIADSIYKSFQLLTGGMRDDYTDGLPWELQIARFAVPITVVWLSVGTYLDHARKPLHFLKITRAKRHVVVIGASAHAEEVAKQCSNADEVVLCVLDPDKEARAASLQLAGIPVVLGDPKAADTYRRVRLRRAQGIVIATGDTVRNINIAAAVRDFTLANRPNDEPPLTLVAEVEGAEMRALLDASFRQDRDRRIDYRAFDGADNIARSLLPRLAPLIARPGPLRSVLMIGLDPLGEAILFKLIRNGLEGSRVFVAVPEAEATRTSLEARFPFLKGLEAVTFLDAQPGPAVTSAQSLQLVLREAHVGAVVVNAGGGAEGNQKNLTSTIALRRFARDHGLATPPVFVRQVGGTEALEAIKLMRGENIDTSRIQAFGSLDEECDPDNVLRSGLDALAMRIHEAYRASAKPGPATVPWTDLDETFRTANRNQADHIIVKLAQARCRALTPDGTLAAVVFTDDEIETLARLEHWRWWMDRMLDGWVYGERKYVAARTHPGMVPYDQLSEDVKEYDRIPIRTLTGLLVGIDRVLVREHRIGVLPGGDPDEVIAAVQERVETVREAGAFPIVVLPVSDASGLVIAERVAALRVAFELRLDRPVSAVSASLGAQALMTLLDAAEDVDVVGEDLSKAISQCVEDVLDVRNPREAPAVPLATA